MTHLNNFFERIITKEKVGKDPKVLNSTKMLLLCVCITSLFWSICTNGTGQMKIQVCTERPRQCNVHQCGSSGLSGVIPEYQCLTADKSQARGIKGNWITEGCYAAVLLMCATHFHYITPYGPKTFLLLLFSLLASCQACLLPIQILSLNIP